MQTKEWSQQGKPSIAQNWLSLAIAISLRPFIFPMAPLHLPSSFPGHIPHLLMYFEKIGEPGDKANS